jgi:chemotaxis protein MotB
LFADFLFIAIFAPCIVGVHVFMPFIVIARNKTPEKMKKIILATLAVALWLSLPSCVAKKKFTELQAGNEKMKMAYEETKRRLDECLSQSSDYQQSLRRTEVEIGAKNGEITSKNRMIQQLEAQIENLQGTNAALLDRMADLSIVNKEGAESIKRSLESINNQTKYIQELTSSIQLKDSLNLALVMNLKRSLSDLNDQDIQVEVRGGVVYVSIADRLLFRSGSSEISSRADEILGKVAKVVNDHKDLEVMVEGHTDNVPISTSCVADNWDLSVRRATAVVRVLQNKHGVAPERITAAGRSEFIPKTPNSTAEGRSINRRTEIVLTPRLDQFFKLLESPPAKK